MEATSSNYIPEFVYNDETDLDKNQCEIKFNFNKLDEIDKIPEKIDIIDFTNMVMEISTKDTHYYYDIPKRNDIEFYGGYKLAIKRGVALNQVKVANLNFTISNSKLNYSNSVQATMFQTNNKDIWILVFPTLTDIVIQKEKKSYLDVAKEMIFKSDMDADAENELLENLNELNNVERCSQTLIHEFGHVLNWRILHKVLKQNNFEDDVIDELGWFINIKYINNVVRRTNGFFELDTYTKLKRLKESFAEDYRILISMKSKKKYILPNSICCIGDFHDPKYREEGVDIVSKVIEEIKDDELGLLAKDINSIKEEEELDRIGLAKEEYKKFKENNFKMDVPDNVDEEIDKWFEELKYKRDFENLLQKTNIRPKGINMIKNQKYHLVIAKVNKELINEKKIYKKAIKMKAKYYHITTDFNEEVKFSNIHYKDIECCREIACSYFEKSLKVKKDKNQENNILIFDK